MRWDRYLLGASYYPEWWPEPQWDADFAAMAELGFNTVRLGEFAWSRIEPEPGLFRHRLAGARHRPGPPAWAWRGPVHAYRRRAGLAVAGPSRHPRRQRKGRLRFRCPQGLVPVINRLPHRRTPGGCASGDGLRQRSGGGRLELDNEPGYPFHCFDANCRTAFQHWLRDRYRSLPALNAAWCTAFWSQTYTAWEQIGFPLNRGDGGWNPGQKLDYHRFFADQFAGFLREQADTLRRHVGDGAFISTNWPNTHWSVDCFGMGEALDATGWDNYNSAPG